MSRNVLVRSKRAHWFEAHCPHRWSAAAIAPVASSSTSDAISVTVSFAATPKSSDRSVDAVASAAGTPIARPPPTSANACRAVKVCTVAGDAARADADRRPTDQRDSRVSSGGLVNTARLIVIFDAVTAEGGPTNPSMYPNLSLALDTAEPTSSSWSC